MVRGSWFGLRLNGFAEPNGNNIALEVGADESDTDAARIGGKSARDANVFAGGDNGVVIAGGDRNRILGNLFSVNSLGTPLPSMGSPVGIFGHGPDPAVGNRIGIRVSRAAARSPECDGGCNAIARGEQSGIALFAGGAIPPRKTKIQGNFIGLEPDGESPLQNEMAGVNLGEADGTTIGGSGGARNVITGGELAVMQQPGSRGLELRSNLIGFDSSGQAPLDPPDGDTGGGSADFATRLESAAEAPTVVSGNRFAFAPDTTALAMFGEGAVVTRNVFGLRRNGGGLPAQPETQAILVAGKRCVIGRPGAGNVIGNTSFSGREAIEVLGGSGVFEGDRNVIEGNRIGVDSDGDAHPITGGGIGLITTANRNRIGGTSAAAENLISNVSENPIELLSVSDPMSTRAPTGNRILRNRGAGNGTTANDLFVNLDGLDGFGNGVPELQGGIEAPVIEEATRTRIEGSGAEPGADVWIYRTRDPAGASPANLRGFVAKTTATGAGEWAERFDRIAAADNLTALQEGEEGSSELALAVAP